MDSSEKLIEEDRIEDPTRVDIVLPANFLDEMDDEGHKKRRYSLGKSTLPGLARAKKRPR